MIVSTLSGILPKNLSLNLTVFHTDLYSFFVAVSFDLYARPGNNRTLTLMNPKKSFYQWRLRVPSNYVVRLVVITLPGVTPESCASHHLSAYDFLLPLQNKIITRYDTQSIGTLLSFTEVL